MASVDLQHFCLGCMTYLEQPDAPCPVCGWQKNTQNQPHQLIPGSFLAGKYMIGRSLGQGGFGITYIAWDTNTQEKVAIKEYYPSDIVTRGRDLYTVVPHFGQEELFNKGRDRFFSEAQNMARFDSDPNIVSIKNFFQENGTAYIVMEFIEGSTLKQYLANMGRPMLIGDALALLAPIAESLTRLHTVNLIHRDISPDNIMLTRDGSAKLLDFGAARAFSMQGERSNTVNVKMNYAPKEQFFTRGEQGPWTDEYALAATIYNAITKVTPTSTLERWEGPDTLQPPSALGVSITPNQEAILLKGMAMDHKNRYKSIREFYDNLKSTIKTADAASAEQKDSHQEETGTGKLFSRKALGFFAVLVILALIVIYADRITVGDLLYSLVAVVIIFVIWKLKNKHDEVGRNETSEREGLSKNNKFTVILFSIFCALGLLIAMLNDTDKESKKQNPQSSRITSSVAQPTKPQTATSATPQGIAISTLVEFHRAITNHDYRLAYSYFHENMKAAYAYKEWMQGFDTTVRSEPLDIKPSEISNDGVTLTYTLKAVDNPGGTRFFDSTARIVKTYDGWKIFNMTNTPRTPKFNGIG